MRVPFVKWIHDRPEMVRVAIAAAAGTVLSWITYEIIYFFNPLEPRATSSWTLAFLVGIFRQHHLHRTLSFPRTKVRYASSLGRSAAASIAILVASASLNFLLTEKVGLHHRLAWLACLTSVGAIEYALMKLFVFRRFRGGGTGNDRH